MTISNVPHEDAGPQQSSITRRGLMQIASAGAVATIAAPVLADAARPASPPDVGSKFYADGRVHAFPGNTVICHLPQQGSDAACFNALMDVYRDAPRHRFVRKVALLPPSSYHMTVFGGANDRPRLRQSWPADLPLDMPMAECDRITTDRLRQAGIRCALPIRMRVDPSQDPTNGRPLTMRLLPLDDGEAVKLATVRREIARATRIPLPEPDTYRFHISIGYSIAWLTAAENVEFVSVFNRWSREIAAHAPVIALGAPEFCVFQDMYAFHRVLSLT